MCFCLQLTLQKPNLDMILHAYFWCIFNAVKCIFPLLFFSFFSSFPGFCFTAFLMCLDVFWCIFYTFCHVQLQFSAEKMHWNALNSHWDPYNLLSMLLKTHWAASGVNRPLHNSSTALILLLYACSLKSNPGQVEPVKELLTLLCNHFKARKSTQLYFSPSSL